MQTLTLRLPLWRNEWFTDYDGILTTTKREDETRVYVLDYTDWLNSGESVSSTTITSDGPVVTSSLSSPNLTLTVSKTGYATIKATTSASRVLELRLHWQGINHEAEDYT